VRGDTPRVHILLLNWNGWRDTIECLESIFRLDYPNFQVVVCDNASTDDSPARIKEWAAGQRSADPPTAALQHLATGTVRKPVTIVELDREWAEQGGTDRSRAAEIVLIHTGGNLGFAGGNNVGLRHLLARESGYVWLLNNDTVVAPDSLRLMVETLERRVGVGLVGATLLEYGRPDIIDAAGGGRVVAWQGMPRETTATGKRRGTPGATPHQIDFITCGCMLARLQTVHDIGIIDERYFMYCEDIDYSLRVRASGLSIVYCPEAEIWHKGGSTVVHGSPRHDYYLVRSALMLVQKFHPALLPLAAAFSMYRCLLPKVVRFQGERVRAVARAYRDFAGTLLGRPGSPQSYVANTR
jgi:GT2 family glycosyltransferase